MRSKSLLILALLCLLLLAAFAGQPEPTPAAERQPAAAFQQAQTAEAQTLGQSFLPLVFANQLPTPSPQPTPTATPWPSPPPGAVVPTFTNGDLEDGFTGWGLKPHTDSFQIITHSAPVSAHSGSGLGWMRYSNLFVAEDGWRVNRMEQVISVPAGTTGAYLSLWLWIDSREKNCSSQYWSDAFIAWVGNYAATNFEQIAFNPLCFLENTNGWRQAVLVYPETNFARWAGQTVRLRFELWQDSAEHSSSDTDLFVDDFGFVGE